MASESRARDTGHDVDDRGVGGKIIVARRVHSTAAASLYSCPVETASPRAPPRQSRGWLSGIVSGAGRLISSVFRSEDDGSPCSSSESSESGLEGYSDNDNTDDTEDINGEGHGNEEPSANLQLIEDPRDDCQPLASISGSKLAIERLLQQEMFTRDEGNRLIEMIQSRITDSPRIDDKWGTRLLEFPAVMEAKKWVEQKRSVSSPKADLSLRRCALTTDLLHHDNECDKESPVNMAKSYMQSLPAWGSPLARSSGFKTALELHESPFGSSSGPSLTPMKRGSLAIGSWNALEQTRNVRQKTSEEFSEKFGPYASMQDVDLQTSITSERAPELPLPDSHLSPVDNGFCNVTDSNFSEDAVPTAEQPLDASRRDELIAGALTLESGSLAPDKKVTIVNEQIDPEIILPSNEQGCSVIPSEPGIFNSSCIENKGPLDNFNEADLIAMHADNVNLEVSSPVGSSLLEKNGETKCANPGHPEDSEASTRADDRSHENEDGHKEIILHAIQLTSNGDPCPSSSAVSEKGDLSPHALNLSNYKSIGASSNGDLADVEIKVSQKVSPKASIDWKYVRGKRVRKVHDEITIRDIKDMLKEDPKTSGSHSRTRRHGHGSSEEKKAVLRPRRSRRIKQ